MAQQFPNLPEFEGFFEPFERLFAEENDVPEPVDRDMMPRAENDEIVGVWPGCIRDRFRTDPTIDAR